MNQTITKYLIIYEIAHTKSEPFQNKEIFEGELRAN